MHCAMAVPCSLSCVTDVLSAYVQCSCIPQAAPFVDMHTQVKRTEGVSTTDIVGRMLTCTRVNPFVQDQVRYGWLSMALWSR